MKKRKPAPTRSFLFALVFFAGMTGTSKAQVDYSSALFHHTGVTQNDSAGYAVTADIIQGGVVAGQFEASVKYGGGSSPFDSGSKWGPSSTSYRIYAQSSVDNSGNDTADGFWKISVTPMAGWQVDGISVFTNGSTIGNPTFQNVVSDGVGSVFDGNNLITSHNNGDPIASGDDIDFAGGSSGSGIPSADHSNQWAYNSAGATEVEFTYMAGYDEAVALIQNEALRVGVQLSQVPEPSSALVSVFALSALLIRRRRS